MPEMSNPWRFWCRAVLYVIFFVWGGKFMLMDIETNEIANSFWHSVNIGFHEAGHIVFRVFGRFMGILGGTLGQLLVPLVLTLLFIFKNRDYFGASLATWWLGQSFMDCAPYINDALAMRLNLVFGDIHDWNYLLNQMGVIRYHHGIAVAFDWIGMLMMVGALTWGGVLLFFRHRDVRYG